MATTFLEHPPHSADYESNCVKNWEGADMFQVVSGIYGIVLLCLGMLTLLL